MTPSYHTCEHGHESSAPFNHDPKGYGPEGKEPHCYSYPVYTYGGGYHKNPPGGGYHKGVG